jgi:hypothetical protein
LSPPLMTNKSGGKGELYSLLASVSLLVALGNIEVFIHV